MLTSLIGTSTSPMLGWFTETLPFKDTQDAALHGRIPLRRGRASKHLVGWARQVHRCRGRRRRRPGTWLATPGARPAARRPQRRRAASWRSGGSVVAERGRGSGGEGRPARGRAPGWPWAHHHPPTDSPCPFSLPTCDIHSDVSLWSPQGVAIG